MRDKQQFPRDEDMIAPLRDDELIATIAFVIGIVIIIAIVIAR